jgi:hypothetical protein
VAVRLWHDDKRPPPKGQGWTWARTNSEAQRLLASGDVSEVSLDYDMQSPHDTGLGLVRWMGAHPSRMPPKVEVHSLNPYGARMLRNALRQVRHRHAIHHHRR